jgi:Fic family protein
VVIDFDPRKADAAYKPFPPFAEWANTSVDEIRWTRYTAQLKELRSASPDLLSKALEVVKRATAFDTGAIEGLYSTDRGLTFTVATQAAMWEDAVGRKGGNVQPLFESQLRAYDMVLDLATRAVPIAEAWIRQLHGEICFSQATYRAWTELGWQEVSLPKAEYKQLPNHVVKADGTIHSYAPVDMTLTEMFRLVEEIRSPAFETAHPALQAAYSHYALAAIHPFADGNGRVVRALASVFSYRCCSVPILILTESRSGYLSALAAADAGSHEVFVEFISNRIMDAIQMSEDALAAAASPPSEFSVAAIERFYGPAGDAGSRTREGYTVEEVDQAAMRLLQIVGEELAQEVGSLSSSVIDPVMRRINSLGQPMKPSSRPPLQASEGTGLYLSLNAKAPVGASVVRDFSVEVPIDCGREDDLLLRDLKSSVHLEVRITDLLPSPSPQLLIRVKLWAEGVVRSMLDELARIVKSQERS